MNEIDYGTPEVQSARETCQPWQARPARGQGSQEVSGDRQPRVEVEALGEVTDSYVRARTCHRRRPRRCPTRQPSLSPPL